MYYYSLRISITNIKQIEAVNSILRIKSNYPEVGWGLEIVKEDNESKFNFINYFLSIIEGKNSQLRNININNNDISIWVLYEYQDQCNLEFTSTDLKRIGAAGVSLCISCWEKAPII